MSGECALHIPGEICMPKNIFKKLANSIELEVEKNETKNYLEKIKKLIGVELEVDLLKYMHTKGLISDQEHEECKANYKPFGKWVYCALSDSEVDNVCDMYEYKFPDFINLHFNMIDFAEYGGSISPKICDYLKLYKGEPQAIKLFMNNATKYTDKPYRRVASVLNSDVHTGPGKHWTCIFIDMSGDTEWSIEFYNSSGNPTYKAVLAWQIEMKAVLESIITILQLPVTTVSIVEVTNIRHQYSETECGPFCLYYIYTRLNGVPYSYYKHNPIKDAVVTEFRKQVFIDRKAMGSLKIEN